MGTKNNVNPDHYKEEGRERPGQDINQEINKQKLTQAENDRRMQDVKAGSKFIPGGGALVVTETPTNDLDADTGQAAESANSSSNT